MDGIGENWEENEHVFTMTALHDVNQPFSCTAWGDEGIFGFPVIIDDESQFIFDAFSTAFIRPSYVFIDHTMTVYYKSNNVSSYLANTKIAEMLDQCGPCDGSQDCGLVGDVTQDGTINVIDIVTLVNMILGPTEPEECSQTNADYNGDGVINVLDIIGIVNEILDN